MPRETLAQLQARIDELELRNADLEVQNTSLVEKLDAVRASGPATPLPPAQAVAVATGSGGRVARSIVAGILIVLGVLITPLALVMQFATQQVTDTDNFVATYGPLAASPVVQEAVTNAVVQAIDENVDLDGITSGLLDGLKQLDLPDFVSDGVDLLKAPLADGIRQLVTWAVNSIVTSEWFPGLWEQSLRLTHSQLNATLRGDAGAVALLDGDTITLQLAPVIESVKAQLVDAGVSIASIIPDDLQIAIPIANVSGVGQIKAIYAVSVGFAIWLPIVALVLLIGGIALVPRRRAWTIGAGIGIAAIMLILGIGLGVGRAIVVSIGALSPDSLGLVYDTATGTLVGSIVAIGVLALAAALVAWIAGPGRAASAVREVLAFLPKQLRLALDRAGATRGAFGRWVEQNRRLLYWVVAGVTVLVLVFVRPLTVTGVVLTAVGALVLLIAIEVLRAGPPAAEPVDSAPVDEELADLPA